MKKGKFIVFDGSDGSGKQTQVAMLVDFLRKKRRSVATIDFPQYEGNFHGKILKVALQGEFGDFISLDPYIASFLYTADRFESVWEIKELLECGGVVVADRFTTANMIHQGGKFADPVERDKYLKWLLDLECGFLEFPKPDTVIFLKVPVGVSLELIKDKKGKDKAEESISYLTNSLVCAEAIAKKYGWIVIDCTSGGKMRSRESIHEEVVHKLCL